MENLSLIIKKITDSKRVAIIIPEQGTVDAISAAAGLSFVLPDSMIFSSGPIPKLPFIAQPPQVSSGLSAGNQLVINISDRRTAAKELRYEKTSNGLSIYITPESGQFMSEDVSVLPASGNFDLVVIIGAASPQQLGKMYTDNTNLFFNTTSINVDNNPANEFYGTLNLVNATASSLSEVVMDIVEGLPNGLAKEQTATCLLAGIISQTGSFRDPQTTPSALLKASRLVAAGARQQDIIQHLFKTKPLPLLQLWGRALARLTAQPEKRALTAIVTAADMQKTHVDAASLPIVLRDIVEMVTGFSLVAFLAEAPEGGSVHVLIAGLPYENILEMMNHIAGSGGGLHPLVGKYEYASSVVKGTLAEVQSSLSQLIDNRSSVV